MLDTLRRMIGHLTGGASSFDGPDHEVAAAALMVHVATVDGEISASERQRLEAIVRERYGLDEDDAQALIAAGEREDHEALDLSEFTSVLRRSLDEENREALVEMLWEMAQADGVVHEFEENLISRAADLLGIDAAKGAAIRESVLTSPATVATVEPEA
jgi:uncharacterized tellurite resistance protein B-like protein